MANHPPLDRERLKHYSKGTGKWMDNLDDNLDLSNIQEDGVKADLVKEYLETRRYYARTALIIIALVCITITLAFLIFGNQVSGATIEACRSACQADGSFVREVTPYKCTCIGTAQGG